MKKLNLEGIVSVPTILVFFSLRGECKINSAHFLSFEDGGREGFENCLIIKKAQKMSIIFFRFKI